MSRLAALQDLFQRAVLDGDDRILGAIPDGARERKDVLFGVYRNAYVSRLTEVVRNDYPLLHAYLGDDDFDAMAASYIAEHPSTHRSARHVASGLPAFLARQSGHGDFPHIAELAAIEKAISDAFDAADAAVLQAGDLAGYAPDAWSALVFRPHPSATFITLGTNALDIWSALSAGEDSPEPVMPAIACSVLVWRQDYEPRVRALAAEEAMMWKEAVRGVRFGILCEMLATYDDADNAAGRAASYLAGWLQAGMLKSVVIAGRRPA